MDGDALAETIIEQTLAETAQKALESETVKDNKTPSTENITETVETQMMPAKDATENIVLQESQASDGTLQEAEATSIASEKEQVTTDVSEEQVIINTSEEISIETTQKFAQTSNNVENITQAEALQDEPMDITESLTLSDKVVEEDVILTPVETTNEVQEPTLQDKIENEVSENFVDQTQAEMSDTIMHKLEQLPDSFNVASDMNEPMSEINSNVPSLQEPTDILQEAAKKIDPNKWKPKVMHNLD